MSRIAMLSATLCVAVGLAACEGADLSGPEEASPDVLVASEPHAGPPNGPRAVMGYLEGSDQYGDACGDGQGVLIISTGYGTVSHFGVTKMVSASCVSLSDWSVIGTVPFTLEAANGDKAGGFLTDFVLKPYGFDLYTEITWGTGRFEGASGELVFPTQSDGTGIWSSGVEGWITY